MCIKITVCDGDLDLLVLGAVANRHTHGCLQENGDSNVWMD